jgi:hypothetical protein
LYSGANCDSPCCYMGCCVQQCNTTFHTVTKAAVHCDITYCYMGCSTVWQYVLLYELLYSATVHTVTCTDGQCNSPHYYMGCCTLRQSTVTWTVVHCDSPHCYMVCCTLWQSTLLHGLLLEKVTYYGEDLLKLLLNFRKNRKTFQNKNMTLIYEETVVTQTSYIRKIKTCVKFVSLKASPTLIRCTLVPNLRRQIIDIESTKNNYRI